MGLTKIKGKEVRENGDRKMASYNRPYEFEAGDTLTIKGETRAEQEIKREDYLYQERRYGAFSRSVVLPGGLKSDKAEATVDDGILTVTIPKAEEVKPRAISVKAKEKK